MRYHVATGRWKRAGKFEWHVFSVCDDRAQVGARTQTAYQAVWLVIPEDGKLPAFCLRVARLPDFSAIASDVYVGCSGPSKVAGAFRHSWQFALFPRPGMATVVALIADGMEVYWASAF